MIGASHERPGRHECEAHGSTLAREFIESARLDVPLDRSVARVSGVAGTSAGLDPALAARFHEALAAALHDVFLFSLVITFLGIAAAFGMTGWPKRAEARSENPAA